VTDRTSNIPNVLALAVVLSAQAACRTEQQTAPRTHIANTEHGQAETFLGVRILKTAGAGDLDWSVELPASCTGCRLAINRFTSGQNSKEFYFHLLASSTLEKIEGVHVKAEPAKIRGVLVGRVQVLFSRTADGISFAVPRNGPVVAELSTYRTLPGYAAGYVTDLYTYIETPSVETRIEHADEKRRNGAHASGPWPAVERQAALNLEFAAREAIVALGLDRTLRERGLDTVLLMGFDTNDPTLGPADAHNDDPPHWHMHMSWSRVPIIREIGHFYIGSDGLLIRNGVGDVINGKGARFERGQTHKTLTEDGEILYTHTITPEGYFTLGTSAGVCRFTPVVGGFHTGVDLACRNGAYRRRIRAEDDIDLGRLRLFLNERLVEEYIYDPDNGVLERSEITYDDR
jgi:hypothetical protein